MKGKRKMWLKSTKFVWICLYLKQITAFSFCAIECLLILAKAGRLQRSSFWNDRVALFGLYSCSTAEFCLEYLLEASLFGFVSSFHFTADVSTVQKILSGFSSCNNFSLWNQYCLSVSLLELTVLLPLLLDFYSSFSSIMFHMEWLNPFSFFKLQQDCPEIVFFFK